MISFAVTVCDEATELGLLLSNIYDCMFDTDEIVIQYDAEKVTQDVKDVVSLFYDEYGEEITIKVVQDVSLNNNFAEFKNKLKQACNKKWIFQIDADECMNEGLAIGLHEMLEANENTELINVPRINTVDGITEDHIKIWRWNHQKVEDESLLQVGEFSKKDKSFLFLNNNGYIHTSFYVDEHTAHISYYAPVINYPDYQSRIFRNLPKIKWINKVHERIVGYQSFGNLPPEFEWSLLHMKTIAKQEKQNHFYETL